MEPPTRISPLVYYALWLALSRYDVGLCRELEERHRVQVSTLEKTRHIPLLSGSPVKEILEDLIASEFYHGVVWFAGEAAFSEMVSSSRRLAGMRIPTILSSALKLLREILPGMSTEIEEIGDGRVFRCRRSPFVVPGLGRPCCAFISGFVTAAMLASGNLRYSAEESMCVAMNTELAYCLFELK